MNWSLLSFRTPPPPSINHYLPPLPSSAYQSPPPLSSARHNCVTVLHLPLWLVRYIQVRLCPGSTGSERTLMLLSTHWLARNMALYRPYRGRCTVRRLVGL
ncbi:uncharacterized protein H6S33_010194 [Morchella sextelata]|uniref:uncharacterized protein n=1 Tax=Morchella sextelata TaxID=1174677 RepID=UPI001D037B78|nr:uncharacterized protein H6S33_010194 [Morchella sextelata]KAH0612142.1 hypothetical protein H6S33_010194 [Morchella sextelata]